jgi:hypothetical protein
MIDWEEPYLKKNSMIVVPLRNEIVSFKSGILCRRGAFGLLRGKRLQEVREKCETVTSMTVAQGLLIRKQVMVTKQVSGREYLLASS